MHRVLTKRDMGDGVTRYRVRIEGDDCSPDSHLAEQFKWMLLSNVVDNPALVMCGPIPFQTLHLSHNGERWIMELEALTKAQNG